MSDRTLTVCDIAWMVDRVREVSLLNFDIKAIFRICDRYAENLEQLLERKNGKS